MLEISISPEMIEKMVRCIADAVGDDIREDFQRSNLKTDNSFFSRIWDYLNTNLLNTLETDACDPIVTNRGPWDMVVLYENTSQCIFTFMREKRFAELQRRQRNRKRMHYIDMVTRYFNSDLLADQGQMSLFPHEFSDEDRLAELVGSFLHDLSGGVDIVRRHVLVLFNTDGFQLTSVRAVMITPSLEIAKGCEEDWSKYIANEESLIVERVENATSPMNQPDRGLSLTAKALSRKKDKPHRKSMDISEEKES